MVPSWSKNNIYLITNKINRKQYVGLTTQGWRRRFKKHIADAYNKDYNMTLHKAIVKYL